MPAQDRATLKVMSFNIRYGTAQDGANDWDARKEFVMERIRAFAPDLLGMQECRDDAQAAFVKSQLPEYVFVGMRRGMGDGGLEMAPVLFRRAAFDQIESGHFWLSETPRVAGSKNWGAEFPRTVTWARARHVPSGRSLTFVNTHFDYQPTAGTPSAAVLRGWLEREQAGAPVILTGDFNVGKDSLAYGMLTQQAGLLDALRQVHIHPKDEGTFHGFGACAVLEPIDWILCASPFEVVAAGVDTTRRGFLFPSDHYPVVAQLRWRE